MYSCAQLATRSEGSLIAAADFAGERAFDQAHYLERRDRGQAFGQRQAGGSGQTIGEDESSCDRIPDFLLGVRQEWRRLSRRGESEQREGVGRVGYQNGAVAQQLIRAAALLGIDRPGDGGNHAV